MLRWPYSIAAHWTVAHRFRSKTGTCNVTFAKNPSHAQFIQALDVRKAVARESVRAT